MKTEIKFNSIRDIQTFVCAASTCAGAVDVCSDRLNINGKSILGFLCIDITHPVVITCDDPSPEFIQMLQMFTV